MFVWTDEASADLRQCITKRMSGGATAAFLTAKYDYISRSACMGKASRLRLRFESEPIGRVLRLHRRSVPRLPQPSRAVLPKREPSVRAIPRPAAPPKPRALSYSQTDETIPVEQRKSLLDLTNETCRWGIGDPLDAGFFFCGAPEASFLDHHPYCERHSCAAYTRHKPYQISEADRERRRRWARALNAGAPT